MHAVNETLQKNAYSHAKMLPKCLTCSNVYISHTLIPRANIPSVNASKTPEQALKRIQIVFPALGMSFCDLLSWVNKA